MPARTDKKISFILSSFRAGGGEKQMIEIANAFVQRGHTVDLLVLKPIGPLEGSVDARVNVVSLDLGRMAFSLPRLVAYLRRRQPQALLSLDEYTHVLAIVARTFARVNTRVVLRIGNMLSILAERYEGKARMLPSLNRRLLRKADGIVANSFGVAGDAIAVTGIDASKVMVIVNPKSSAEILEKAQQSIAHPWFGQTTIPVIVAVGRLRVQKNFEFLVRAFAILSEKHPARLVIVGGGREESRLRAVVEDVRCVDKICFTGYVENPYAYMAKAYCVVTTSLWEGMPNALLEALICGAPVIASDCSSGPREILAPDTDYRKRLAIGDAVEYAAYGALYAVNDSRALVEALSRFLTDFSLRETYARASTERSKYFDGQTALLAYEKFLLQQ